jgi:hypothetical protein
MNSQSNLPADRVCADAQEIATASSVDLLKFKEDFDAAFADSTKQSIAADCVGPTHMKLSDSYAPKMLCPVTSVELQSKKAMPTIFFCFSQDSCGMALLEFCFYLYFTINCYVLEVD